MLGRSADLLEKLLKAEHAAAVAQDIDLEEVLYGNCGADDVEVGSADLVCRKLVCILSVFLDELLQVAKGLEAYGLEGRCRFGPDASYCGCQN